MSHLAFPLLVGLIIVALGFDFLNGLHDAANSIATVVGTRLVSPVGAVAFAAFFNFAAYFLALKWPALHNVAETIGKGLIDKDLVTPAVVFGALIGAMFWNVVTWLKGIPSSSSHALVGGIVGAGVAHAGFPSIQWIGLNKTLIAIVAIAGARSGPDDGDHAADKLARGSGERAWVGADVSGAAPGFLRNAVAQPRPQRCSENDGADHRTSLFDGLSARRISRCRTGWR